MTGIVSNRDTRWFAYSPATGQRTSVALPGKANLSYTCDGPHWAEPE